MSGSRADPAANDGLEVTILDACAVINLDASGALEQIVRAVAGQVAIADRVLRETQDYPRNVVGDAGPSQRVKLLALIRSGVIDVLTPQNDIERGEFVDLAFDLDDGEAMTMALAIHRGCTVVTDDRKAIRLLGNRAPLRATLDLVKAWAEQEHVVHERLRAALLGIRDLGAYVPHRSHPLRGWWDDIIRRG